MNNKIIILRDELKNNFLNNINSLLNVKIITLSELKKKYYFDYDKKALYFISKKYNVIYDVSKKYMESIYLINDKYHSKKVDFLRKIKDELIDNNLIEYNELFHEFLKNKDIVIYNIEKVDKFYINIFKELESVSNVEYINDENKSSKKKIYECNNKEEEISFVASEICKLIKNGIDINNIKLCNVNESYIYTIRNIFKMFNIPIELEYKENILGSLISQKFIEYYDKDISKTLDKIKTLINDEKDEYVYNKIINIVNNYYFVDNYEDVKDLIIEDISKIQIESKKYDNSVRIVNLEEIRDNDYCFLINFNEGSFPIKYKDEDFLSDKETKELCEKIKNDSSRLGIIYESPKRIMKTLEVLLSNLGDINICLSNDLTKKFEKKYYGTITSVINELNNNPNYEKGEYVLIIEPIKESKTDSKMSIESLIIDEMLYNKCSMKDAIKYVSEKYGIPKNNVYQASLNLKRILDVK